MNNAIVIYDNLQTDNLNYKQRIIDITEFYVYQTNDFKLVKTNLLTQTLLKLLDEGIEWVVINNLGHGINQPSCFLDMIEECKNINVPLMGHIMFKPNSYPHIDDQCFILNLNVWKSIGFPDLEPEYKNLKEILPVPVRSEENFHDDYTPHWISSSAENEIYELEYYPFGIKLVYNLLKHGYTVINFNKNFRELKWNLYARYEQEKLIKFFDSGEILYEYPPRILLNVIEEKNSLLNTVYILNSENVYLQPNFSNIDHYIGVASGFKGLLLLNKYGFNKSTKITYVDISDAGLNFQKFLIQHWNGNLDEYNLIIDGFKTTNPNYRYAWRSWNTWESEINSFLHEFDITKEEFNELWSKYKLLNHNFIKVDLLNDVSGLISCIEKESNKYVYMWLSNAFDMQWTRFMLGKTFTQEKFNTLMNKLKNNNNKIILEANGLYYKINCDL